RSSVMRSTWVACSATAFALAETGACMQAEVVAGLWDDFHSWLTRGGTTAISPAVAHETTARKAVSTTQADDPPRAGAAANPVKRDDMCLNEPPVTEPPNTPAHPATTTTTTNPRDPESLSTAHRTYLRSLARHLLLTQPTFTEPLYSLLISID